MTEKEWKNKEIIILYPCKHQIHLKCFFTWICYSKCNYQECIYCRQYINYFVYDYKNYQDLKYILTIISKNLQIKCKKIFIKIFDNETTTIETSENNFHSNLLNWIKDIFIQNNLINENKKIISMICQIMTNEIILNKLYYFNNINGYFIYNN